MPPVMTRTMTPSRPTDRSGPGRDSSGGREETVNLIGRLLTHPAAEDIGPATSAGPTGPDGAVIVDIGGDLDIASAPAVRERLLSLLRPGACRLVIDMSAVRYADASGLAVLVSTQRRALLFGGELRLAALVQAARSLLSVLSREPLSYSPGVAATASRLRWLFPAGWHPAMG